jgi:hypothetical protein
MDCRLCRAYQREKAPCPGCRGDDSRKPKTRVQCRIKQCAKRLREGRRYCIGCSSFPCKDLVRLDSRYRKNYGMTMIGNLGAISKLGIGRFIAKEAETWTCSSCGSVLCVHEPRCPACGRAWR